MYNISKELMDEIISGLSVYGSPATDSTIEKLRQVVRGKSPSSKKVSRFIRNDDLDWGWEDRCISHPRIKPEIDMSEY